MPCIVVTSPAMTMREASLAAGFTAYERCPRHAKPLASCQHCRVVEAPRTTMLPASTTIMCGEDLDVVACGVCGCYADLLCDFPMGRGKTCDLPICGEHAREVGDNLHLCALHFPVWQKRALADRINPWPPVKP